MKVLVTGGAGFMGSHVVELLIKKSYDVVVVDNLVNGKKENINKKAKFYRVNILNQKLREIFIKEKPNYVIHLAAQISVINSIKKPLHDARVNILGSIKLLELCREFDVERVIYSSSCARYGEPKRLPCKENDLPKPLSPYGISKYAVEHYLSVYHGNYGLDYNTLILGNVYGPKQDPHGEAGVISIFIRNLLKGKECVIYGDGNQTRDFIYVRDVARAFLNALKIKTRSKLFNIATGKPTTVNKIFSLLMNLNGGGKCKYLSKRKGDVEHIYLDISKAKKELRWKPEIDIKKGISLTYKFFSENCNKI